MSRRSIQAVTIAAAAVAALSVSPVAQTPPSPVPLTVHEWGTFTSIAGADGQAVRWQPQQTPEDLPCFVERSGIQFKLQIAGTVRMETPVIYFYAPRAVDVSVDVAFKQGLITEWYPHAAVTYGPQLSNGTISWPMVHVTPGAPADWRREPGASHYYTARETAADPVRVGAQPEKFLFYRGLGQFQPPIAAVAQPDGGVELRNTAGGPIGDAILFENRRGAMTFTAHHLTGSTARLPRPDMDDASAAPLAELARILVAHGLYEAEAQAMVNTWKDSWFEEGARLLYIPPRADVDAILPLTISPTPSAVERVFVGRMELVTPATLRDVRAAIESGDTTVQARYGRFLRPIAERAGLAAALPASGSGFIAPAPANCR
jgi:hypothetical protein